MPLETKVVHIPLVAGMTQKADQNVLAPPGMQVVLNKQFSKQGAFDTRPTFTTATTNGYNGETNTRPRALIGMAHDLVTVDDKHRAFAYDHTYDTWSLRGRMPMWQVSTKPILRSSVESLEAPQIIGTGGYMWAFYKRDGAWRLLRLDAETGAPLGTEVYATPAGVAVGEAKIATNGLVFCVLYADTTHAELRWTYITVANPSQPSAHWSVSGYTHTPVFDMCAVGADFAFGYSVTASDLYLFRVDGAGGFVDISPTIPFTKPLQVSVDSTDTDAYIAAITTNTAFAINEKAFLYHYVWSSGGTVYNGSAIYDFTGDDQLTGGIAITLVSSTDVFVLCTKSPWTYNVLGTTYEFARKTWGTYAAIFKWNGAAYAPRALSSATRWTAQVTTDTRPFQLEDRWYAWFRCDTGPLGSPDTPANSPRIGNATGYVLLDLTPQVTVSAVVGAFAAPAVAWAEPRAVVPQPVSVSNTHPLIGRNFTANFDGTSKVWSCCAVITGGSSQVYNVPGTGFIPYLSSTAAYGADLVLVDMAREYAGTAASIDSVSLVNGATPWVYGGVSAQPDAYTLIGGPSEWGFFTRPDDFSVTSSGAVRTGTVRYAAIYEWTDDLGHKVRSEPAYWPLVEAGSAPTSMTLKASMAVKIPYLKLTGRQGMMADSRPVAVVLYRADSAGDGLFHRVTPTPASPTWENKIDPTVQPLAFTDTAAQKAYEGNEFLYTVGGVSEDQIPPPFSCVVAHKGRFFGAAGAKLWFSKQYTFDAIPGFNSLNVINVSDGDEITGLASLDGSLVVFKSSGIYVINGEGPSDAGAGYDYGVQKVATPLGCVEPRSVATTSEGVVFQAREGLFMLNRSMQIEYIGAGVEDDLATWPVITSATYVPDKYQVRFTAGIGFNTGETPAVPGVTLVYDLTFKQWARWTSQSHDQGVCASADGRVARLEPLWSSSTADVLMEQGDLTENGVGVASGFITAWVKMDDVQGYQRVRRVMVFGQPVSQTGLVFRLDTDYGMDSTTYTLSAADVVANTTKRGFQYEIHVPAQKCESLRLVVTEWSDTTPFPPASSFKLVSPPDISMYSPGQQIAFIAAQASGAAYAFTGTNTYTATVTAVTTDTVFLDQDVSAWTIPPHASWWVVDAAWLGANSSAITHRTTASATGETMGQAYIPAVPGRGMTWESVALEVATMDMRYKGMSAGART